MDVGSTLTQNLLLEQFRNLFDVSFSYIVLPLLSWRRLKRRKAVETTDKEGFSDGTQGSFLPLRDARNQIWGEGGSD